MIQKFSMGMHRLIVLLLIIPAVCFILASCSTARLAYDNGERLSYWWLDGYLDISAGQRQPVKDAIAQFFTWHRSMQLPEYGEFLLKVERRLQPGQPALTLPELQREVAGMRERWQRMTERAAPALADLARNLQPGQLGHLQEKLAASNAAYRKEYLRGSLEDRQRHRFRKLLEQVEYWFGDLDAAQEARIRAASDARPLDAELTYADRLRRQAALVALLDRIASEQMPRDAAVAAITALLDPDRQQVGASPQVQAYFRETRSSAEQMMLMIMNSATEAQRATAAAKVRQWRLDLKALAR
jgi:hypothetical protein